jgi:CheY-like chemotaxis protein
MCNTAARNRVQQTILIVEDDADLRRMFRSDLVFAGYRVLEAGDGLTALRILDSSRIDAVVLDLMLPMISGQVVLQEVAAQAQLQQVPVVVVVTGSPESLDPLKADCVLAKPVTSDHLINTIRRCMAAGSSIQRT